jgi:hypothetical protein
MIYLTKGQTDKIIITLSEMAQLLSPNYLLIFKSKSSNQTVKFILLLNTDISNGKSRYNEFDIVTNTYFADQLPGEWTYTIYEQASTTNLDITKTTSLIEQGQMVLKKPSTFTFTTYTQINNTYKVRDL